MDRVISFNTADRPEFIKELREKVNDYFNENNISKQANSSMVIKTIILLCLYLVPYFLIVLNVFTNPYAVFSMWMIMAFGMAGIGFSIVHDANHGAYSRSSYINKILENTISIVGGYSATWKIQHNVLHHIYTNIHEYDEDLDTNFLLRFTFQQKRLNIHRVQHYYAWFLYSLFTISWTIKKDFSKLKLYKEKDLIKTQNLSYKQAMVRLIFSKLFYFSFILMIPLIFSSQPYWLTIIFYLSMHLVCGFLIAVIFQLAHKVTETSFPIPEENGNIDNSWAVHQLYTTANFATNNLLLSWFVGGLNFQIEHHFFPNICHVHYRKISGIVKELVREYNLPYYENSFWGAISSHANYLMRLGKYDKLD